MKWHRIKPGQYELRGPTGTRWGIIERSSLLPSMWWWSVWGPETDATPLRSTSTLARKTRIAPVNRARRAKAYARNFGPRADAVRAMPCLVAGCRGPAVAAHARARGMGGAKGDARELVPLCQPHHLEAGEHRTSQRAAFELTHGLDLRAAAKRIAALLDKTHPT